MDNEISLIVTDDFNYLRHLSAGKLSFNTEWLCKNHIRIIKYSNNVQDYANCLNNIVKSFHKHSRFIIYYAFSDKKYIEEFNNITYEKDIFSISHIYELCALNEDNIWSNYVFYHLKSKLEEFECAVSNIKRNDKIEYVSWNTHNKKYIKCVNGEILSKLSYRSLYESCHFNNEDINSKWVSADIMLVPTAVHLLKDHNIARVYYELEQLDNEHAKNTLPELVKICRHFAALMRVVKINVLYITNNKNQNDLVKNLLSSLSNTVNSIKLVTNKVDLFEINNFSKDTHTLFEEFLVICENEVNNIDITKYNCVIVDKDTAHNYRSINALPLSLSKIVEHI